MKFDRFTSSYRLITTTIEQKRIRFSRDPIKELHGRLIRAHNHADPIAISPVLSSYSRSPYSLRKAQIVFTQIQRPTLLIFNHMIRAFSQSQDPAEAIYLYDRLRSCGLNGDNIIFVFVFKACGRAADLVRGKRVHVNAFKLGFQSYLHVSNALMHMYGSFGELVFARNVFDEMPDRDLVSWNSLICAYSQHKRFSEVVNLFNAMLASYVEVDDVTLLKVVLACIQLADWELADYVVEEHIQKTHIEMNVYLGNTMIDMYGKRGLVKSAHRVFDQMVIRNLVSWNALIMGYAKLGDMVSARNLFNRMPGRDVVSWTSMITGYCQVNHFQDAVNLFQEMIKAKVVPDEVTVSSVLSACAHLGKLNLGKEVHQLINKHRIREDIHVGNALIDMYSKCGVPDKALDVFLEMKEKDSVSLTSVITGLAVNGFADRAIQLFDQMLLEKNLRPTHGSFVAILLACAHAGLVDKGLEYFDSMEKVYRLKPQMKHYGCVVDLLSRSGFLERAYEFISRMPVQPDVVLWRTLLSACNIYRDVALAETVLNKLLQLDPGNSGNYVLLSQTYAGSNRWDAATRLRDLMKEGCVHKPSALSSIEAGGSEVYK